jgi:transcriptional regulator with XRE-family HTH domain
MNKELKLTTGEMIMLFRIRRGLTQKQLGDIVFKDLQTPNVKVKKIEKGQQRIDEQELKKIAEVLEVPLEILQYGKIITALPGQTINLETRKEGGYRISKKVKQVFPEFPTYLQAVNSMAKIGEMDLLTKILQKMCKDFLSATKAGSINSEYPKPTILTDE